MAATTILEVFESRVNESSTRPALRRRVDDVWGSVSWKEWWEASERVAAGLCELGIASGDRVLILSETRLEWLVADMALHMLGAVSVPVYPSLGSELVGFIAADSGAVAAIVADPIQLEKLVQVRESCPALEHVCWIEPEALRSRPDDRGRIELTIEQVLEPDDPWNRSLEDLAAAGRHALAAYPKRLSSRRRAVVEADLATIVYTSGTTGEPRGVMLSQQNLASQVRALGQLHLFSSADVQVLFLPLAHIFARVLSLAAIGGGVETALVENTGTLLADMAEVEPTFFAAVPQVFEQVRAKLERDAAQGPLRERLFRVAEQIGQTTDRARRTISHDSVFERLGRRVLEKVQPGNARDVFGGRVRFAISGGAPLGQDTAEFFAAFGLDLLEGYGLTETTAVCTVNVPADNHLGSVGQPLRGVDITIDEDGEILVRGQNVTSGYWGDTAGTAAAFDEEGWLRTGDLGIFDRDGFLHITGRKKELIVTAGGKNVAPAPLEAALESLGAVQRAFVYGDRRPYVVALLAIEPTAIRSWADENNIEAEQVLRSADFLAGLSQAIGALNAAAPSYADIRRWGVVPVPFSEEEGELTATGKLRRARIAENHAVLLAGLYAAP